MPVLVNICDFFVKKLLTYKEGCDILCKAFLFTAVFGDTMFEKNLNISFLLDFYGEVLSERTRSVLDMYYNEDLSLAEIADIIGISRQGVRQIAKKGADDLLFFENKLGLANKFKSVSTQAALLLDELNAYDIPESLKNKIEALSAAAK